MVGLIGALHFLLGSEGGLEGGSEMGIGEREMGNGDAHMMMMWRRIDGLNCFSMRAMM